MNNGKICVSVCAEIADELIAKIKQAEEFADVIEVRFDCLDPEELSAAITKTVQGGFEKPLVATYRDPAEGGPGSATFEDRLEFWNKVTKDFEIGDLEGDMASAAKQLNYSIHSFHASHGVPGNVEGIYDAMFSDADIWKIAVQTNDICDAIPVWRLIERARKDDRQFIPVAMSEAGKWTRILGLAHGAFLTYGSLNEGDETAPGQFTAKDLTDVYRVKELDLETKVFGVIGNPVSESLSPYIHNVAFVDQNINAVFIPLQVKDLDEFIRRMVRRETREVELNFHGFSVTMPHKQSIIKHLDEIDPTAKKIGAVNTVKIVNDKLIGYNTDAYGFITPLTNQFSDLKDVRVAVYGAGGASRACIHALKERDTDVTVFARDSAKAKQLADHFNIDFKELNANHRPLNTDIIVNATPLGMRGRLENESLFTAEQLKGVKFVYDLVTSSTDTPIIREAKISGIPAINGFEMLIHQGAKQFEIWTGQTAPIEKMRAAILGNR